MKIQTKSGESLADVYDVEGSIAGIEELQAKDVNLVHEMGSTIFSERLAGSLLRAQTGAILQTITFDVTIQTLPQAPSRILGIQLFADFERINFVTVSTVERSTGRELPIFVWETGDDAFRVIRISDDGGAAATRNLLVPAMTPHATMLQGVGQRVTVQDLVMRGVTATFGAGTVNLVMVAHLSFAELGGVSSKGLPIPSW